MRASVARKREIANAHKSAAALVVAWEGEVAGDPLSSLLRMVQTSAMAERAYAFLLESEPGLLTEVDYGKAGGLRSEPHAYVKLWNEERDRLAKFAKAAVDAGIADRQVKVAERTVRELADVVESGIKRSGLSHEQQQALRAAIGTAMRERLT